MFFAFLKTMGLTTGLAWLLLALPLYLFAEPTVVVAILIGTALPALCFIPGFYTLSWAIDKAVRPFMIAVFGGMLVRLLFIGAVFTLLIKLTPLHVTSLLLSMTGFYTLYMIIELYFVNNRSRPEGGM